MKRFFCVLCCLIGSASLFAWSPKATVLPAIPNDTTVRIGQLPNGLTYYIKHNAYVPNRASFHIVQKVGSILEQPEQRGLAHFLEHMAFNGTRHFPDKELINYLEKIGVKFGANLNAYTSVDETVYMISDVPTQRVATVDSCLLILRDWSDGILLEEKAIDQERGVIEEEWRSRDNAIMRQLEQILPQLYGNDKYADCMPIGSIDVIRNFSYDAIRSYYKLWYRPDLQGIVVVGDIDVDATEQKIKTIFADAKVSKDAPQRIYYGVSDYQQPLIVSTNDKEMPYELVALSQKIPAISPEMKRSQRGMKQQLIRLLVVQMCDDRLSEIVRQPNPPFANASVQYTDFFVSQSVKSIEFDIIASSQQIPTAIQSLLQERERMYRYGFTQTELDRAKATFLTNLEQSYNNRNKRKNDVYVQQCINHFVQEQPIIPDEWGYKTWKQVVAGTSLKEVNEWLSTHDANNWVLWMAGSEDTVFPTSDSIMKQLEQIAAAEIEPYKDAQLATALIDAEDMPVKGKIIGKKQLKEGVVQYKLSNGVIVQVKPTTFKEDEIILKAMSKGGLSMLSMQDVISGRWATDLAFEGGIGPFSYIELDKFMADKKVDLKFSIAPFFEHLSGISSVKDIETLFQLLYLSFTEVKTDTLAFQTFVDRAQVFYQNLENDPTIEFVDAVDSVLYQNNPMIRRIALHDVKHIDYDKALQIYRQRFANAADFTFSMVGNINIEVLEPLLEQYVASLPTTKVREDVKRKPSLAVPENRALRFTTAMQQPKTSVLVYNRCVQKLSSKQYVVYQLLEAILGMVYTETVREEQGGTYGVSARINMSELPQSSVALGIQFETDSAKVDKLLPIIYAEWEKLSTQGPTSVHLQKAKEYAKKAYIDQQITNTYWANRLLNAQLYGRNVQAAYRYDVKNYLNCLEHISAKDIQRAAKTLFNSPNLKEVIQVGVKR